MNGLNELFKAIMLEACFNPTGREPYYEIPKGFRSNWYLMAQESGVFPDNLFS